VEQVARVIRPNGLVSFSEWDFRVYDAQRKVLTGSETDSVPSHVARFCSAVNSAARARGGSVDAASFLTQWCLENDAFDPETVHHTDHWLPASPWCKDVGPDGDLLRAWGEALRENSLVSIALTPKFVGLIPIKRFSFVEHVPYCWVMGYLQNKSMS
jgi:hypothetical protein